MPPRHRPISHSAREQWKGCNKSYFFGREMRLEPKEKKKSLRMGTAFGLCVEHRDPERAAEGYWEGIPLHERVMDRDATLEIAQVKLLAELYCERYPDHRKYDVVEHEVGFDDQILGPGFLDGVFETWGRDPLNDMPDLTERVGMEGKLLQKGLFWNDTSRLVLAIDDQVTAYFAAMRELGRPLDKLLYRVTFKPGITQNSKTKETLEAYLDRLRGRIADDPSYAFEEHVLYRTDAQLDRFLEECADVNEQVKLARRRGAWPKNTKNCTAFGGCVFLPICREETGALDEFKIREVKAKPKLPRLGKNQRAVLLALGDSFTVETAASDVARQAQLTHELTTKVLSALVTREFVQRIELPAEAGIPVLYALTPEGEQVVQLLRPTPSA